MKKYLLLISMMIIPTLQAGLPEFSTPKCAKGIKIKAPVLKGAAGHYWSSSCTVLYIKPPKKGELVFTSSFVSNEINSCKDYSFWTEMKDFYQNEIFRTKKKIESTNDELKRERLIARLNKDRSNLSEFMISYNGFLDDSANIKPIRMKFELDSQWSEIVASYRELNKDVLNSSEQNLSFEKLPIQVSFMSATFFSGNESQQEQNQDVRLHIPGVRLSDDKYREAGISNDNSSPILFSEYLTGIMDISLKRTCSLIKNYSGNVESVFTNHKSVKDLNQSLKNSGAESNLSFSATYSYPLYVNMSYKVELTSAKIESISKTILSKLQNTVHPSEIFSQFMNSEINDAIKITMMSEDVRSNLTLEDEKNLRNEVISYLTEKLVNSLKNYSYEMKPVDISHFPNKVAYNKWQRQCRKKAWGLYKKCKNVLVRAHKEVLSKTAKNEITNELTIKLSREAVIKNSVLFFTNQTF